MSSVATPSVLTGRALSARRSNPALGLAAICLGFLMITLDATIVNVALGPIVAERVATNPMVDPALFRARPFSVSVTIGMLPEKLMPDRPTNESDAAAATVVGPVGFVLVHGGVHDSRCWSRLEPVEYEHPGVEEADV